MCIERSVGNGGVNAGSDVTIVQVLLSLNQIGGVGVDGVMGPATMQALRGFQSRTMGMAQPDGRVDPGGATLDALRRGIPAGPISELILRGIMPTATASRVATYLPPLLAGMAARGIDTALRQAHFLAQVGHESGALRYNEELASGEAYEGRTDLGNPQPGDGPRFKGRGLIQLTGRANYQAYGNAIGRDLLADPDVVATDPQLATDVACWFWQTHNLNRLADADDVRGVTRVVNGGLNGLTDREAYLRRGKFFLAL